MEIVTDFTPEASISTLKRFVGRRGIFSTDYSVDASYFVGADSELKKLHNLVKIGFDELTASYLFIQFLIGSCPFDLLILAAYENRKKIL